MLRLHFTREDLLRTTVAAGPDPLWETVLSANLLGTAQGRAVFDRWRLHTRPRLRRLPPDSVRLVRTLAPPQGRFPDFLNPRESAGGLAEGIEAVLSTPRRRLRREIGLLRSAPPWLRPLADGEPDTLRTLGRALKGYFDAALAPCWTAIRAQAEADRALRARALLTGGTEALLSTLGPTLTWRSPVLEADYPLDRDLHLGGRGLLLIPSVFCWRNPITLADPGLPPVLVYPVRRGPGWWPSQGTPPTGRSTLGSLLGRGRAAVLRAVEGGCTTSELARRTGVTPATASEHARILRDAGLLASVRDRNTVLHTPTPLGTDLLAANRTS
ncbi:winged helix-turn-helix domain-containing protein [Streptomyces sp. Rer75]|uniref:winged helix-turn-helix domain-containing protein n=1 Tax=unclassified Streptomyces TaxID=2593676 RepID=UPI0015D01574|nr:winged helix-turn-helix domain-containing protein [Streptomyces sp. Rer75]QLH24860.1 winged helix-turn-helix transcriptional regulator [Streptomyces sp. Rer75]